MAAPTGLYASAFPASGVLVGSPLSIYIFAPYSICDLAHLAQNLTSTILTPLKLASKVRRGPSRVLGRPLQSLEDNIIGNLKPYTKNINSLQSRWHVLLIYPGTRDWYSTILHCYEVAEAP